ncbi:MAG: hypothetical protein AAGM22_13190 [Acidobacteriota bacterium]
MTVDKQTRASDEPRFDYNRQDVINQALVAFGQGTNFMRVQAKALRVFVHSANLTIDSRDLVERWGKVAVQVLERVRTMGRVAAAFAIEDARTYINDEDVLIAMRKVKLGSKSDYCDNNEGEGEEGGSEGAAPSDSP